MGHKDLNSQMDKYQSWDKKQTKNSQDLLYQPSSQRKKLLSLEKLTSRLDYICDVGMWGLIGFAVGVLVVFALFVLWFFSSP